MGRDVHPAFTLPTMASPTLQGALTDGFETSVVACDMPERCKFPSLDSCQNRFLWTHKEVDLAPHPVVHLVLPSRGGDQFQVSGSNTVNFLLSLFQTNAYCIMCGMKRKSDF